MDGCKVKKNKKFLKMKKKIMRMNVVNYMEHLHCWLEKYAATTLQNSGTIFHRGKHIFVYDPVISLLGVYPREMKAYVNTKTCMWIFIAALFNSQGMKQPPN